MSLRVTQSSIATTTMGNLQLSLGRLQRLQDQLSSGRQLNRPSDSPTGTVSALQLRSQLRRGEQLVRNADDGLGWLGTADTALVQSLGAVARVRELALTGRNGAMGPDERAAIATEVEGLRDHLLGLANASYLDRPIFGGTTPGSAAYDAAGGYVGDGGTVTRMVLDGVEVEVNVTGPTVFGPPGADLFSLLTDIADHLRTDPAQLSADLERARRSHERPQVGACEDRRPVPSDRDHERSHRERTNRCPERPRCGRVDRRARDDHGAEAAGDGLRDGARRHRSGHPAVAPGLPPMTTATAAQDLTGLTDIEVPTGLVGFPEAQRFAVRRWGGDDSPYALLHAVEVEDLEFVVVPPATFFPDYAPVVDDDLVAELELQSAGDAIVLVIVTVGDPVERSTANLLGPIVVNRHTRRAAQAVLSPDEHDPRTPLLGA